MTAHPRHDSEIVALKRIEGQIRGIQKMIEEGQYCVDILTQLNAAAGAIRHVEDNVLKRHLEGCVTQALHGKSILEKQKKIEEVLELLKRFRKI